MDVSAAIAIIDAHGFEDTDTTQKLWAINDAIWEIDGMEPWPYLLQTANLDFDGTNPYPSNLPTNLNRVKWLTRLSDGEPIWPERIETVRSRYGASSVISQKGDPVLFYFVGQQLRFWPVPTAATGSVLLDYRAFQSAVTDTTLESGILMPGRYHTAWVNGALQRLYNADDDPELGAVKKQEMEDRVSKMRADLMQQQEMRSDVVLLTDPDELDVSAYLIP
jgi:hypothetical protein